MTGNASFLAFAFFFSSSHLVSYHWDVFLVFMLLINLPATFRVFFRISRAVQCLYKSKTFLKQQTTTSSETALTTIFFIGHVPTIVVAITVPDFADAAAITTLEAIGCTRHH